MGYGDEEEEVEEGDHEDMVETLTKRRVKRGTIKLSKSLKDNQRG